MKFIEGLINGTNVRRLIKSDKRADSDIREGR